jgi:hypothetical protein
MYIHPAGSAAAIARGLKIKRNNAIVAAMLGGCLACIFAAVEPSPPLALKSFSGTRSPNVNNCPASTFATRLTSGGFGTA